MLCSSPVFVCVYCVYAERKFNFNLLNEVQMHILSYYHSFTSFRYWEQLLKIILSLFDVQWASGHCWYIRSPDIWSVDNFRRGIFTCTSISVNIQLILGGRLIIGSNLAGEIFWGLFCVNKLSFGNPGIVSWQSTKTY